MGNAESTLACKDHFKVLHTQPGIASKDSIWLSLINSCVDHRQVFGVVTLDDLRRIRDSHPENLESLATVLVKQLESVIRPSGIGSVIEEQVLCYLRALARLIPVIYENRAYAESIEKFLWSSDQGIFVSLLASLLRLLQLPGFCVPLQGSSLWASGIGAQTAAASSKQNQYNKIELLRVFLVLLGEPIYCLKPNGMAVITAIATSDIAYMFCSLLNSGHNVSSFNPLHQSKLPDISLTTLMLLVVFHGTNANNFRKLLAKLYREEDILLLRERLQGQLSLPSASLLWELLQANPKFLPLPAEPIVEEVLAKQFERKEVDLVRILTFILIQQSLNLEWCSENSLCIIRLYSAFHKPSVHTPALLDLLYNISPLVQLRTLEEVDAFAAYVEAIMLLKDTDYIASLVASLERMLGNNSSLAFRLKDLKNTGSARLDQYFSDIRASNPRTPQEIDAPPMFSGKFVPIKIGWDSAKLRWYNSALWGHVMQSAEVHTGLTPWTNTDIKLFKVETYRQMPTLRNPKGVVEEIGNIVWDFFSRGRSEN